MLRQSVKLIMVEADNNGVQNNKFYHLTDNGDSTFTAEWGRVGQSSSTKKYDGSLWNKKLKEKLTKGYKDNTSLFVNEEAVKAFSEIAESAIANIVNELQRLAKFSISNNYTVSSESVTLKQIEAAQALIDDLIQYVGIGTSTEKLNNLLLEIFRTIPRAMGNVRDHIFQFDKIATDKQEEAVKASIQSEQDLLDVMRGQVKVNIIQKDNVEDLTILQALGIEIWLPNDSEIKTIKKMLGKSKDKYSASYCVKNIKTETRFSEYVKQAKNKKTELLWHGSRNENWWNIIGSGLVLRPANAVRTGSMFGNGSYFSSIARKSIGYSSLQGSYWARGSSPKGFLSVYDVHIGLPYVIKKWDRYCQSLDWEQIYNKLGFDSSYVPSGYDCINDETIVYREDQSNIKYLVEIK